DGVSPKVTVTPGKDKDGQPGHTITIQKPDGSTEDVFIKDGKDGKDGKTPTVEQTPIKDASGKTIGTTIIVKDGDGKEVSRSNVL
ncbi:hypothetical protein HK298_00005, partial [Streptococcus agalactiae]|nr:hypothetical protein [Streptococcus agalactiae]MCD0018224.1 hypothetical protein [Streptococcus agalactiae]MCD0030422.1 hypothetical protein [Streptococcus agalactiae]MCD0035821.1 hypothetical protein [Streptococcus agalactiae]MCD0038338.1 hypothetical protein [Streptococcus agalactiae]